MIELSFSVLTKTQAVLGESPFTLPGETNLWWADIEGRQVLRTDVSTGATDAWAAPERVGFVVLSADGSPFVGMESGLFAFSPSEGTFQRIIPFETPGARFNDATVDATGRLWAATMDIDNLAPIGCVYAVLEDGTLSQAVDGLTTPNGLAVDDARARLYFSDSHVSSQHVWSASIDRLSRAVGERNLFADFKERSGRPDGAAIDRDGVYWIAGVGGGALHAFSPEGAHLREFETPFDAPTKPAFGGPEGERLFLTSKGGSAPNGSVATAVARVGALRGRPQTPWRVPQIS